MSTVDLPGCTPEPLVAYLKALGVLRLVAEQADAEARGIWEAEVFSLRSRLDADELVRFFLDGYAPTPVVAPWNGGSGFYEGDRTEGLEALRATTNPRFGAYRDTIESILAWPELPRRARPIRDLLDTVRQEAARRQGQARAGLLAPADDLTHALDRAGERGGSPDLLDLTVDELHDCSEHEPALRGAAKAAAKLRTKAKALARQAGKQELVQAARGRLGDRTVEWVDAAVALSADGRLATAWLLGSGGNEGRLDYTNVFMRSVARVLIEEDRTTSEALLRHALFDQPTTMLGGEPVGQFDPGRASGPTNPWSFVLAIEGAIVWTSSATRRQSVEGVSSPFTVRPRAVGFSSASGRDEAETRAEIWAPLWHHPLPYRELRAFLGEGRAELGRRAPRDGIEFAQAAASLGVDRGVSQFVRYGLVKRRGDSYLALPAGRFEVRARSEADLVRQLNPLLGRLDAFLRRFPGDGPPPQFASARRTLDEAIFHALTRGGANLMRDLVAALGRLERLLAQRDRSKEPRLSRPLSGLRPEWINAANDGSIEVRIAAALSSIRRTGQVGPLRANLSPVDPGHPDRWAQSGPQVDWRGSTLSARLAGVLARRIMDATRLECPYNPVGASLSLSLADVCAFLEGALDEALVDDLLFGFSLVEWHDVPGVTVTEVRRQLSAARPLSVGVVPTAYALLKLLFLPGPLTLDTGQITIRPEPAIVPLLVGGRISEACRIAQRRLVAAGLRPVGAALPDGENGTRLAAALLLPVSSPYVLARRALLDRPAPTR